MSVYYAFDNPGDKRLAFRLPLPSCSVLHMHVFSASECHVGVPMDPSACVASRLKYGLKVAWRRSCLSGNSRHHSSCCGFLGLVEAEKDTVCNAQG